MALEEKIKEIITKCPHYYDIVNSIFDDDDRLTKKLINEYSLEIFNVSNDNYGTINRLKVLDTIIYEYISKSKFYYHAKDVFNSNPNAYDMDYDILQNLIDIYMKFTFNKDNIIYEDDEESRWL